MIHLLPKEKREFLKQYPWMHDEREIFLQNLKTFKGDLIKAGFTEEDLIFVKNAHLTKQMVPECLKVMLEMGRIELLEEKSSFQSSELKHMFPEKKLCVCDFSVDNFEKGRIEEYGIVYDDILIIDHHASIPQMQRYVSSTVLAIKYVSEHGPLPPDFKILINHADTDSILSMLIMAGLIDPEQKFGEAAISSDHTGEENTIGDMLQSFQHERDISFSVKNLTVFLHGKPIDSKAQKLVEKRHADREKAKKIVEEGLFRLYHDVAYVTLDKKIDAGLVPPYLPKARIIVIGSKMPSGSPKPWEVKVRLGLNANGIYLNKLGLPEFGGRWNAGSTKRSGGTNLDAEEYARVVHEKIKNI